MTIACLSRTLRKYMSADSRKLSTVEIQGVADVSLPISLWALGLSYQTHSKFRFHFLSGLSQLLGDLAKLLP